MIKKTMDSRTLLSSVFLLTVCLVICSNGYVYGDKSSAEHPSPKRPMEGKSIIIINK